MNSLREQPLHGLGLVVEGGDVGEGSIAAIYRVSGEIVDADEEFSNGLRWPRDTNSEDAAEVINCRCTLTPVVVVETSILSTIH